MARMGMLIDLRRCIGCHACTIACKVENGTGPGVFWNRVEDRVFGSFPTVRRVFLPRLCMHCADPACKAVCPTGATYVREDGIVLVDQDKCIGCRYCVVACPYQARTLVGRRQSYFGDCLTPFEELSSQKHSPGTVGKCTFCYHRLAQGLPPACVSACPVGARIFGDVDDPRSEICADKRFRTAIQLLPEKGTRPRVVYSL